MSDCVWIPPGAMFYVNATIDEKGYFQGIRLDNNGEEIPFVFPVPSGFSSLINAYLVYIALANKGSTDGMVVGAQFGAAGEDYNDDFGSTGTIDTGAVTNEEIYEVDVSGALTDIAAGDYVAVRVSIPPFSADSGDRLVIGFKFEYAE